MTKRRRGARKPSAAALAEARRKAVARGLDDYDHDSRSRTMVAVRAEIVRELLARGLSLREAAAEAGMSPSAVARIARQGGGAHALPH